MIYRYKLVVMVMVTEGEALFVKELYQPVHILEIPHHLVIRPMDAISFVNAFRYAGAVSRNPFDSLGVGFFCNLSHTAHRQFKISRTAHGERLQTEISQSGSAFC